MAKWGEGDPRWIVEERADATNVNNWHWTERDATSWSSDKLKALLLGLCVENEEGTCEVTEVSQAEGEASINNRKGKLIFFYEWSLKATWTGTSKTGIKYKGNIEVPNLSDENDMEDLDISVTLDKDEPETPLASLMKKEGAEKIRAALGGYVGYLKTEFTQGMILPTANGLSKQQPSQSKQQPSQSKQQPSQSKAEFQVVSGSSAPPASSAPPGVKIPTCSLRLKESFVAAPKELYRVFLSQERLQAFTRAAAVVDPEKGGRFRLLDGSVTGEFQELVPEKKIVMKWRYDTWPCEHYATFTLTFWGGGGQTELGVEGRGVPAREEQRTLEGWRRHYFHAIKQTFGYGA